MIKAGRHVFAEKAKCCSKKTFFGTDCLAQSFVVHSKDSTFFIVPAGIQGGILSQDFVWLYIKTTKFMMYFKIYKHIMIYPDNFTLSLERRQKAALVPIWMHKKCLSLYCNNIKFIPNKELGRLRTEVPDKCQFTVKKQAIFWWCSPQAGGHSELEISKMEIVWMGWAGVGSVNDIYTFIRSLANQSFSHQSARCSEAAPRLKF